MIKKKIFYYIEFELKSPISMKIYFNYFHLLSSLKEGIFSEIILPK